MIKMRTALACALALSILNSGCAQQTTTAASHSKYDADLLFGYDKTLPLSPEEKPLRETSAYEVFRVSYRSAHDQRVPALLVLPKKREGKIPCVMLMHGLGGSKDQLSMFFDPLVQAGYACFAVDAFAHGERKSADSLPVFGAYAYATRDALAQTVIDLRRGIDYLESRPEIDASRVGYIGASMGGILGSIFGGVDTRLKAPILLVAGGNWKVLMEQSNLSPLKQAGITEEQRKEALRVMDAVDPIHWVGKISPRPVLMINGDNDQVVTVDSNKALHAAANEPKQIIWYKGDHVPPPTEFLNLITTVTNWLNKNVKESANPAGK